MKTRVMAAIIGATMVVATPMLTDTAAAQAAPAGGSSMVPIVVGAAAGATIGALVWPVLFPAPVVIAAAPGAVAVAPEVMTWGFGAFMTTRAAIGAVIGAGTGYLVAR